jgi:hypothetical protein
MATTLGESSPAGQIWNGSSWKATSTLPSSENIDDAISCVSEKFCFQTNETKNGLLAAEWNGSKWMVVPTPSPPHRQGYFYGVSCSTLKLCVAVGSAASTTLIEQWDGKTWSIQRSPDPGQVSLLESVSCVRVNVCMAVGDSAPSNKLPNRTQPLAMRN